MSSIDDPTDFGTSPTPTTEPDQVADSTQGAQESLLQRPYLSIRTRVFLVFLLLFILCGGITLGALSYLSSLDARIGFLEDAASFSSRIEEARRNEKNYFLYGTGLPEALASAHMARTYMERDSARILSVIGREGFGGIKGSLDAYQSLLNELILEIRSDNAPGERNRQEIEARLRIIGAQLLADAQDMIQREREAVSAMVQTSRLVAVGFLAFMLLVMVLFGSFVLRAVLRPLQRFIEYVGRIGAGNYEPITPTRKYRDEFSALALAFNRMLREIVTRQDQLVQSGKMAAVGTLTSGIAHELNNPLNNISLTVEALVDDFDSYSDEKKRRMLDQIATQVERAGATVRNLLDFTRKGRPVLARLSLADTLRTTLRLIGNEATLSDVEWSLDVAEDLPDVSGNPQHLQQVFLNLFLNSIQAMPEGGVLSVRARRDGEEVRVDVVDTGEGIPQKYLEQIFVPFFTTKEPGQGTGLGLSVTHGIIEKHGGRIEVESEEGESTIFSVFLPIKTQN